MPMNTYETKLKQFQGPLPKLLELIEARKLEVSDVSLGEVTGDFLAHLEALKASPEFKGRESEGMRMMADFLAVASRLVLLKSKSLLPGLELSEEEQGDLNELELRLKSYRELKPLFKEMEKLWGTGNISFARPYFLHAAAIPLVPPSSARFFYPGERLNSRALVDALKHLVSDWQGYFEETDVIREKIISLEEQMKAIVERLQNLPQARLTDFSATRAKGELIVIFLALLHLARDQAIFLRQEGQFSDILVASRNRANGRAQTGLRIWMKL